MKKNYLFLILLLIVTVSWSQGLKTQGKKIVNSSGEEVVLRGMGLGGWMLMEGYMMQSSDVADTQHEFRERLEDLIGVTKTDEFFDTWLENHVTKKEIDSLAKWGFNSVRLPMHYNLFTPPIEEEAIEGEITWLEKGFTLTDNLLDWCKSNNMYLILDLHGAPGGQGANAAISDYDPSKPSLWESQRNKDKTIALWRKLADRYKNEEWIGGYDLLNEVNWTLPGNTDLRELYINITTAIREVDNSHIIFIEGNSFANDFTGLTPAWDDNMVYSFHKYWSHNDQGSIKWVLDLRENTNVPLWMGEGGENSNVWFTDAIKLFEENGIGWSWWPMKRIETIVGPYSITFSEGYKNILSYWRGEVDKPSVDEAYNAMMELAVNTNSENCAYQKDVPDAMIRQVQTDETIPFSKQEIPGVVYMSDFDLGRNEIAYSDKFTANYSLATGSFQAWNSGWVYRNDAVDIQATESTGNTNSNGYHVGFTNKGEWMNYTVEIAETAVYKASVSVGAQNNGGQFHFSLNGEEVTSIHTVNGTGGWEKFEMLEVNNVILEQGKHILTFYFDSDTEFNVSSIEFTKTGETSSSVFTALSGHTKDTKSVEFAVNQSLLESSVSGTKDSFTLTINGVTHAITSVGFDSTKKRTIILETDKTLVYTDEVKVSYSGTAINSSSGKQLEMFSELDIINTLDPLFILPGVIQVEDYVEMDGLGVETTEDVGGGLNIGYTETDDYADYIVYSEVTGSFEVDFRFAGTSVGEIGLYLVDDNNNETELLTINTPNTGDWQNWETVSGNLNFSAGIQKLRLKVLTGGFNMNWMEFKLLAVNDDLDGDSIRNENDDCPNTEPGVAVNDNGCAIFTLPINNFNIAVFGESCLDNGNGKIEILAAEEHNYKLNLTGNGLSVNRSFTNNKLVLSGIDPGVYELCITVDGEDFEQCFTLEIAKAFEFSAKSSVSDKIASVQVEQGTAPFIVLINGDKVFETMSRSFDVNVKHGDKLEVKTAVPCEGQLESEINLYESITAFPNPSRGEFTIAIPKIEGKVNIEVFNVVGQCIDANRYTSESGNIYMNLSNFPNGIYMVKIFLEEPILLKLIKE